MTSVLLSSVDFWAFAAFMALWSGYTGLAEHSSLLGRSLSASVTRHRLVWMRGMCDRDNRVPDTTLMANLMRSVAFLASSSVLILGGVVALLGSGERGWNVVSTLPFADHSGGLELFEIRLALVACVFIYAFFQMTWSLRQFNYCCILMGAAPMPSAPDSAKDNFAKHSARLQALAANSFNRGLRAYYFAIGLLAWFITWWALILTTLFVVAVLYRREFRSKSLRAINGAFESV